MKKYAIFVVAAILALTGCSSNKADPNPPAAELTDANQAPEPVKAGDVAKWDNGLTVQITKVTTQAETHESYTEKGHDMTIQITVEIANTGKDTFEFGDPMKTAGGPRDILYYGENLYEAQEWASPDVEGMDALPKQLVPGSAASYTAEWSLPSAEMNPLTFDFTPDAENLPRIAFSDVQSLIQQG